MDIATLLGAVAGFVLIAVAIFIGGGAGAFLNVPAVLITVGGTACATLVHFPMAEVIRIFSVVKRTFAVNIPPAEQVIEQMSDFARTARRDGVLALEETMRSLDDDFLAKGLQLLIDGTESDQIREVMLIELNTLQRRNRVGSSILSFMGDASPAFGMIGTLIGLVQMLRQLDDPSKIGGGMATALLTTFYGALLANLLFIPLAGKLRTRGKEEETIRQMMIEGLTGIQAGVNPSVLEDRLTSFLAPGERKPSE
ncbi:MAG: motility protein A [Candidatus Brocadiaceae bacterium]|jgi:chemotaxis protein MotA